MNDLSFKIRAKKGWITMLAAVLVLLFAPGLDVALAKSKFAPDEEFRKLASKDLKPEGDLAGETGFGYGEVGGELDVKNYKKIVKSRVGPPKKKTLVENVFYSPRAKTNRADYTVNGELVWYGAYKRINRLDDNLTPAFHNTDFNFWVDSKNESSPRKEHFFFKIGAFSENGDRYDLRKVYLDDTFGKIKLGALDIKAGNCIESIGSGDNISFIDILNPRRYNKGLTGDYNKTKKALPMLKTTVYLSEQINLEMHVMPVFEKSELADIRGVWATGLQKYLGLFQLGGGTIKEEDVSRGLSGTQLHFSLNGSFEGFQARTHFFKMKENIAVANQVSESMVELTYPEFRVLGVDGNVDLGGEYLLRGEMAWYQSRRFTAYDKLKLGEAFKSDQISGLLGIDRTFANSLYINLQGVFTHIYDLAVPSSGQKFRSESGIALRVQKGYLKDKYQVEFQGFENIRTKEYFIKTHVEYSYSDMIKYLIGKHINDGGYDHMGAISEFYDNNHTFLQMKISW
ncbi:MAG TPA: hypothetical protein PK467_07280 [Candidatus Wallbacteria bacterium]|nr:hypothetical protein [Candidatus Wallbacteria bacterium]